MTFEEISKAVVKDTQSKSWQFAVKNMNINFSKVNVNNLDFIGAYECSISRSTINGKSEFSDKAGYIFGSKIGLLIICSVENDFPIIDFIYSRDIRVVEANSKLFKAFIRIKTNENSYEFKVDKKQLSIIEKFVNSVRGSV